MKKILSAMLLLMIAHTMYGQLLTENFSYTAGQPITANGWTAHSGAGTNAITVTSPGLIYTGHPGSGVGNAVTMTTSGEDDNRTFTATSSGSVYMSFLVNLSAAQTAGDYFIGLFQSSSVFPVRIYAKSDGAGGYFFGAGKGASTAVYETTQRTLGITYFIVAKYTFNTVTTTDDVVDLWVNAALGGTEPSPTIANVTGTSTDATSITAVYLRQGSATNASTQQVDAILAGTTWADVAPSGAVPTLSIATPLSAFGNVCINTTAGPNSFTISGSNLTTANVAVAALSGYEYATSSGGPYTTTLSITQPGGTFSQQVFVRFTPTAVQSYNGNIAVSGGGVSTPVNAAAAGSGVNTAPSITTGAASSITLNSATAAGTIPSIGCSAITAYGIEYSTTAGFPNGSGTQVAASNLSAGNFSSNLTGLASGTPYYYKAYATNAGGTTYGAEQTFTTLTPNPTILTTPLTAFGNVCINTTAGPNSFTINGSNLTNANVTVGPLTGYTFSTTSGGTYTASLSLTQPGGTYTQQIFVRFTPTAVQSYNGNIPVNGGGIASVVNVAASGSGVNTTATVTTGAASAITQTTATAAGSIPSIGCSAVSAYGIEYSTTNNFPTGSGTQVASSNLSGGNFSSALTGLTPATVYYYRAYATNAGGTVYGNQASFTTAAPTIAVSVLAPFGNVCINTTSNANSFTITGVGFTNANVNVGPLTGYTFSTSSGGTYTASLSLSQPGGAYSQTIFVKFTPVLVQSYTGSIPVSGGGAAATSVTADGSGVNTLATVVTGAAGNITNNSATLAGSVPATGCSNVTAYGIEFSGINGFVNGSGTKVASSNISGSNFTASLTGLVQGATYYYKAYAINNGGISYGLQQTFTVASIREGFVIYPAPAFRGTAVRVTANALKPGYYGLLFINSDGQLVYQRNINIQANFINQEFVLPGSLTPGIYRVLLVNNDDVLQTRSLHIF
ncbi:MAG TPA: hypothetical protein VFV31_01550 [Chitinophagaceae bacterium]|nr:hypothetical protein [Chitinophagaceae bacterium]